MKLQIEILGEVLFELAFMDKENDATFYYFGFTFLFFEFYLWRWEGISDMVVTGNLGIPYTQKHIFYEKYLK